jgi:hypothetical protein
LTYFSDLSSDREINKKAINNIIKKAGKKVNDDIPFKLVNDVDYGNNAKIIKSLVRESPVRPRRNKKKNKRLRGL